MISNYRESIRALTRAWAEALGPVGFAYSTKERAFIAVQNGCDLRLYWSASPHLPDAFGVSFTLHTRSRALDELVRRVAPAGDVERLAATLVWCGNPVSLRPPGTHLWSFYSDADVVRVSSVMSTELPGLVREFMTLSTDLNWVADSLRTHRHLWLMGLGEACVPVLVALLRRDGAQLPAALEWGRRRVLETQPHERETYERFAECVRVYQGGAG